MNGLVGIDDWGRGQGRLVRWMAGLSLFFHAGVILLGSMISSYFPPRAPTFPVVVVELTEAPLSTLPEEKPVPPPPPSVPSKDSVAARPLPVPAKKTQSPSAAQRWLRKLDAGLPSIPDAPIAKGMGKPGGIPVRRWANDASPRPGDFAPAVAPENSALLGQISRLEGKVRQSGIAGVGTGREIDASVMFGGVGSSQGEPIPEWIRDMIRRKVLGYLPELEEAYSAAYRRNPELRGKLVVRFQVDPSGKVSRADSAESSFRDGAFITSVLEKVRRWTFEPTGGRTVQVLYPFVFIAPS
ncbi:MAG: AgmX/PglI C-terminal domain-containing protein [Candidatus Deferrimicrobiaceae bacterium]